MDSDAVNTKSDLQTNKLRTQVKAKPISEPESPIFNEIAANEISTNTSILEDKLKQIKNVNSKNGVWSSGILKSPESMMAEGRSSFIIGKDKEVYKPDNNSPTKLKCGSISLIGRRREMEDTITIKSEIIPGKFAFFGVYDGHGGSSVANSCRDLLHRFVEEELAIIGEEGVDWTKLMMTCFSKMDEEVVVITSEKVNTGSTATVAIVGVEEMVVANCGDSRAILSRGGVAVPLSIDHKPTRPDEKKRVEEAGGHVFNWNGYRVEGVLAISRSIGDHYLRPYVISEPTVTVYKRTDSDEFLILATDGLWDVMSNQTACNVIRKCFNGRNKKRFPNRPSAKEVAAFLAEVAISKGSEDNISIIVVDLISK